MTKEEFKKQLKQFFSGEGYFCKGSHFYNEYGICFKSINKYLPYPKFYQLNVNCGRIMTSIGKAMVYENINGYIMNDIKTVIKEKMNDLIYIISLGNEGMINYFLHEWPNNSWYILGEETAAYFGLPKEAFKYHFVVE